MSQPRLKAPSHHPIAYYHCISRVVDKQFKFGPTEKDQFVSLMEEYAHFCGVHIVSYCIMANHFHLLVEVPRPPEALTGYDWLLERLDALTVRYPIAADARQRISKFLEQGALNSLQELVDGYKALMWDISAFMQLLKQRFTRLFNKLHDRVGTLWESRFHSALIEGAGNTLAAIAAYIELNPIRAGIVSDPASYQWSSYGKACQGSVEAMEGIRKAVAGAQHMATDALTNEEAMNAYRGLLIGNSARDSQNCASAETSMPHTPVIRGEISVGLKREMETTSGADQRVPLGQTQSEILARVLGSEPVQLTEFVQIRVRYFTAGGVLGSKKFVEGIFQDFRERFSPKRTKAGSPLRGLDAKAGIYSLRDLRKRLFG